METLAISCDYPDVAHVVARTMASMGISGDVTPRLAVVGGRVEHGALIATYGEDPEAIWNLFVVLRGRLPIRCGWLTVPGFAGCILEWSKGA